MDQLKELFEKYRYLDKQWHIIIPIIIGILIPFYYFYKSNPEYKARYTEIQNQHTESKGKFDTALKQSQSIPALEKKSLQVLELERRLNTITPLDIKVESILKIVYDSAQDNQVDVKSFVPGPLGSGAAPAKKPAGKRGKGQAEEGGEAAAATATDSKKYYENIVKVAATGNFSRMAKFIDDLLHQDQIFHVRNLVLDRSTQGVAAMPGADPDFLRIMKRSNLIVSATFELVIFGSTP